MANLFDKAKKTGSKKVAEKHEIVEMPNLEASLSKMADINSKLAELEAEKAMIDDEIRTAGKEAMIKLFNAKKSFPGTLKIVAGKMSYMFITSDKYKTIDEERFNELSKTYGKDIVTETTVYSFNTAVLIKHMDHISELLMSSKKLSEEDKNNLLESQTTYSVVKGAIKDLFKFKGVKKVDTIIEDIQPIFSIKSVKEGE